MTKKIVWMLVSCLMVLSLVIASCGPAEEEEVVKKEKKVVEEEEEEAAEEEMVTVRLTKLDGTVVETTIEKPEYGGTYTHMYSVRGVSEGWDQDYVGAGFDAALVFQLLITGDWMRGPIGTNEYSFNIGCYGNMHQCTGGLAESFEVEMPDTITYHIRQGVHFSYQPELEASRLVGGREYTADDAVYNIRHTFIDLKTSKAYAYALDSAPVDCYKTDKWTVVVKSPPGQAWITHRYVGMWLQHYPHEVREKYGNCIEWTKAIGTGPYMVVNDVPGSVATLTRNPNYWGKDPLIPENQLPYIENVKFLLIVDPSTRLAAVRTGKVEHYSGVKWEDKALLEKSNPELQWRSSVPSVPFVGMRTDKPPFSDINVRRALHMAVNYPELVDVYYEGEASILEWPIASAPEWEKAYTPIDEWGLAADGFDTKKIYDYNPEEARQLLAKAGYPDGFDTVAQLSATSVDLFSILKEYWEAIGVNMSIKVLETGVLSKITTGKTYEALETGAWPTGGVAGTFEICRVGCAFNYSCINDPVIEEGYPKLAGLVPFQDEWFEKVGKLNLYFAHQVYYIDLPVAWSYTCWQPWLKNYHGESGLSEREGSVWIQYVWIDQELKKAMGY